MGSMAWFSWFWTEMGWKQLILKTCFCSKKRQVTFPQKKDTGVSWDPFLVDLNGIKFKWDFKLDAQPAMKQNQPIHWNLFLCVVYLRSIYEAFSILFPPVGWPVGKWWRHLTWRGISVGKGLAPSNSVLFVGYTPTIWSVYGLCSPLTNCDLQAVTALGESFQIEKQYRLGFSHAG